MKEITYVGTRSLCVDLHNHTPASKDYREKGVQPVDILDAARAAGVDVLGVTDHNSAAWIERMLSAAETHSVTVVPGVEVSTPAGHILALFEPNVGSETIEDLLIRCGIERKEFGAESALTTKHTEDVLQAITDAGGLAVAAHASSEGGILKAKGQYKRKKLLQSESLAALELSDQSEIERYSTGRASKDLAPRACVRGSDSHRISEIGTRKTYLRVTQPTLESIAFALQDHRVHVRFDWSRREPQHPRVLSLHVNQGFLKDQIVAFHDGLTCLVGGAGAGKSTVIELLRHAFADPSAFTVIRDDHDGKLAKLVGDGGTVVVEYLDSDGVRKTLTRQVDTGGTTRSTVRDDAGNDTELKTRPQFFSQGELLLISGNQAELMKLIDKRLETSADDEREGALLGELANNAAQLEKAYSALPRLVEELEDPETGLAATEERVRDMTDKLADPTLKHAPRWENEEQYLADVDLALEELGEAENDHFNEAIEAFELPELPDDAPNKKKLRKVVSSRGRIEKVLQAAASAIETAVMEARDQVAGVRKELQPGLEQVRATHAEVLERAGEESVRRLSTSLGREEKRLLRLRNQRRIQVRHERDVEKLKEKRTKLLAALDKARLSRFTRRVALARRLSRSQDEVRVGIERATDRGQYHRALKDLLTGSSIRATTIQKVTDELSPRELTSFVESGEAEALCSRCGVGTDSAQAILRTLRILPFSKLAALEAVAVPDVVNVRLVLTDGRDRPLRELSTGQKANVLTTLALVGNEMPLVIDHPEEPLDTRTVFTGLAERVRDTKEGRQFIFTTHNPNIAVGGGADLNHVLEGTADSGEIVTSGGVDDPRTNELLLVYLEGGKDALRLRTRKYRQLRTG